MGGLSHVNVSLVSLNEFTCVGMCGWSGDTHRQRSWDHGWWHLPVHTSYMYRMHVVCAVSLVTLSSFPSHPPPSPLPPLPPSLPPSLPPPPPSPPPPFPPSPLPPQCAGHQLLLTEGGAERWTVDLIRNTLLDASPPSSLPPSLPPSLLPPSLPPPLSPSLPPSLMSLRQLCMFAHLPIVWDCPPGGQNCDRHTCTQAGSDVAETMTALVSVPLSVEQCTCCAVCMCVHVRWPWSVGIFSGCGRQWYDYSIAHEVGGAQSCACIYTCMYITCLLLF